MFQNSIRKNFDAVSDMSGAAFSTYDPPASSEANFESDLFEAMNFTQIGAPGTAIKSGGQRAQRIKPGATFNIKVQSFNGAGTVVDHNFEMFNAQNSITNFENNETNFGLIPLGGARNNQLRDQTGAGVAQLFGYAAILVAPGVPNKDAVYWSSTGDLVYNYNNGNSDTLVVSCKEIPYRSLFIYMGQYSMHVGRMRITYGQVAQVEQDLTLTYKNFLGRKSQNPISPSQFKTPTQFQNLIVDVPTPFSINSERGIQSTLLGGSTTVSYMNITFFIDKYSVPVL
jgi:hypothetical protein